MKIMVFTEGTLFIAGSQVLLTREERIQATKDKIARQAAGEPIHFDYSAMVPVGNAVLKLHAWSRQGAEIVYLTSRRRADEIDIIRSVLRKFNFPEGELYFRQGNEAYKDVAERVLPDILVEDDCESIGGEIEMTYPHIQPEIKAKCKSIVIPEAGGIDHLPDDIAALRESSN